MKVKLSRLSLFVFVSLLAACGGGGGGGGNPNPLPPVANLAPSSDAGEAQTVQEQTGVSLIGSGADTDGTITTYSWTQAAGSAVTLTNPNSISPSFDAPATAVQLTLTFRLTVTDNDGATASDTVDITVTSANASPTANAGADKTVPESSFVSFFGDGADTDGSIASVAWTQVSGTAVNLSNPDQLDAGVIISPGLAGEILVFSLEVVDNQGGTATDEISITVEPALTFVDYIGDVDPGPLANVTMDVAEVGVSSLVPATMAMHGYNTIMVYPSDTYNFTIATDSLTLTGVGAPVIAVGDIVAGVTADETAGYAREVTAINGSVYTTVAAKLNQAFPDAEINLDISIFNDILTTASNAKGADGKIAKQENAVGILRIDETLQYEIEPGVKVVEEIKMDSTFNAGVGFSIVSGSITSLSTVVSANYSTAAYLDVNLVKKYSKSVAKEFKPLFDKSKVIFVSGFPVLVNVKAVPVMGAGIDMSAAATLKYGFKVGGAMRSGFEYANDSLTKIAEFRPTITRIGPDYTLSGGLAMSAQATIGVIVTLYDIDVDIPVLGVYKFSGPGLGVDLGPYAKFTVDAKFVSTATPPLTCALDLSVGINSDLSIDYGTLGSQLMVANPENINLYNWNKSLWNTDICPFGQAMGNLAGTVTDSTAVPLGNVDIQVIDRAGQVIAATTSAGDGMYQIDDILIGTYAVIYSKQTYKEATAALLIADNATTDIPVVLILDGNGVLQLSVVNSAAPATLLKDAAVVIRKGLNNPNGGVAGFLYSADPAVNTALDAGYYTLEVSKYGYDSAIGSVSIKNFDTHGVTTKSLPLIKINCVDGWEPEDDAGISWYRTCWASGGISVETPYVNGQKNGVERWYWQDGIRRFDIPYVNGLKNGTERTYRETGSLLYETPYVAGIQHGVEKTYYESGVLNWAGPYVNGLLQGVLKQYWPSGALACNHPHVDGLRHGEVRCWYENGNLFAITHYTNSKLDGRHTGYWPDGITIRVIQDWVDDALVRQASYDEQGNLTHEVVYDADGNIIYEWPEP